MQILIAKEVLIEKTSIMPYVDVCLILNEDGTVKVEKDRAFNNIGITMPKKLAYQIYSDYM